MALENINPTIYQKSTEREKTTDEEDDDIVDEIDSREVFGILWSGWPLVSDRTLTGIIAQINVSNAKSSIVDLISSLPDHYLWSKYTSDPK